MPEVAKVHLENLCGRASLALRNHSDLRNSVNFLAGNLPASALTCRSRASGSLGDWSAWVGWAASAECGS
jgi:hypothetical protein